MTDTSFFCIIMNDKRQKAYPCKQRYDTIYDQSMIRYACNACNKISRDRYSTYQITTIMMIYTRKMSKQCLRMRYLCNYDTGMTSISQTKIRL